VRWVIPFLLQFFSGFGGRSPGRPSRRPRGRGSSRICSSGRRVISIRNRILNRSFKNYEITKEHIAFIIRLIIILERKGRGRKGFSGFFWENVGELMK
jgi:hypothetical protein